MTQKVSRTLIPDEKNFLLPQIAVLVAQKFPDLLQSRSNLPFDRFDRDVQFLGNLLIGEALLAAEYKNTAALLGQSQNSLVNKAIQLLGLERRHVGIEARQFGIVDTHRLFLLAQFIQALVAGGLEQIGLQRKLYVESLAIFPQVDKNIHGQLLGHLAVVEIKIYKTTQRGKVGLEQTFECLFISLPYLPEQ